MYYIRIMKTHVITVRLKKDEYKQLQELATKYSEENLSLMVRIMIRTNYKIANQLQPL